MFSVVSVGLSVHKGTLCDLCGLVHLGIPPGPVQTCSLEEAGGWLRLKGILLKDSFSQLFVITL